MLKGVLDEAMKKETIANGFKRCGLCPFNPDAPDYTKVDVLHNINCSPRICNKELCLFVYIVPRPTPQKDIPMEASRDVTHRDGQNCLNFFESFINPELLKEFSTTYSAFAPIWNGHESAHDLYVSWKKAKDHLTHKDDQGDYNTEKNSLEPNLINCFVDKPSCSTSTPKRKSLISDMNESGTSLSNDKESTPISQREKLAKVLSPESGGKNAPSPYKNHLSLPGTPPKKKGKTLKQKTVKLPAGVSCKPWLEIETKRREEKKKVEDAKLEKKKLREEMIQKIQTKKKPKKLIFDEEEDWTCEVCKRRYSSELITSLRRKWIECDTCNKTYHFKCLPKKHIESFGLAESDEDDDELAFICHQCTKNDLDSDSDPFVFSKEEGDDEEEDN